MSQWLPIYGLGPEEVRSITASFVDAFPNAEAWLNREQVVDHIAQLQVISLQVALDIGHYSRTFTTINLLDKKRGIASLCLGGGEAVALMAER